MASTKHQQAAEPEFEFFVRQMGTDVHSIVVDLSAEPQESQRYAVVFEIVHDEPATDEGLTEKQTKKLDAVEDRLGALADKSDSRLVGRITGGVCSRWYFYTEKLEEFVDAIESHKWKGSFEILKAEDPEWSAFYEQLYPSPAESQSILNRKLIESFESEGDDPSKPRNVIHFFEVEKKLSSKLLGDLQKLGFLRYGDAEDPTDGLLGVERRHSIDQETIDEITTKMIELAEKRGAEYDGWEAQLLAEKNKSRNGKRRSK